MVWGFGVWGCKVFFFGYLYLQRFRFKVSGIGFRVSG